MTVLAIELRRHVRGETPSCTRVSICVLEDMEDESRETRTRKRGPTRSLGSDVMTWTQPRAPASRLPSCLLARRSTVVSTIGHSPTLDPADLFALAFAAICDLDVLMAHRNSLEWQDSQRSATLRLLANIPIARTFLRRPVLSLRAILRSRSTHLLFCASLVALFCGRRPTAVSLALQFDEKVDVCTVYDVQSRPRPAGILLYDAMITERELTRSVDAATGLLRFHMTAGAQGCVVGQAAEGSMSDDAYR